LKCRRLPGARCRPPKWCRLHLPSREDDALRLSGEIIPGNDSALQQFGSHVASHDEVLVDLSGVTRIDYGSVSQFIGVLMQGLGSGKTITLMRGHTTRSAPPHDHAN
jgi:ABC-type transporter Mla MlaB component